MGVIQGRNILIYAGNSGTTPVVAAAKSCTISEQCDMLEKASASNQSSKEFEPGRTEWDISISHLVVANSEYQAIDFGSHQWCTKNGHGYLSACRHRRHSW